MAVAAFRWFPSDSNAPTREQFTKYAKEEQSEVMRKWFMENFADPAEQCPAGNGEERYRFIWGGPYYADEELEAEFGGIANDTAIDVLAHELASKCAMWSGRPNAEDLEDFVGDAITSSGVYLESYKRGMQEIRELVDGLPPGTPKPALLKMIFTQAMTVLETYLGDAFIYHLFKHKSYVRKFVEGNHDFQNMQISVAEVYAKLETLEPDVKAYLVNTHWHNLPKAKSLYKSTFDIDFPADMNELHRYVFERHDLVHRNGKKRDGAPITFSKTDAAHLLAKIDELVGHLEKQWGLKVNGSDTGFLSH
ncbi:MAG TPA: hypothetical protein VL688_08225 [Verrucomicrobiae bacterium]|jgi:hypothetical protein|nr:hypothetical protein [Verrucomicrobiae bacterium]